MSALLIDDRVRRQIADFVRAAESRRLSAAAVRLLAAGKGRPAGADPARVLRIPVNYRCVFTVEEHPQPRGGPLWMRHLSLSLDGVPFGRVPPLAAVRLLLPLFGVPQELERCAMWMEDR